jgi:Domain of unknown function (DUF1735)
MRKLIQITLLFIVLAFTGCLKDTPATDLSHEGTVIEMIYPGGAENNGVGTGLQYFAGCTLLFNPTDASDTVTYYVNIAGTNTLSQSLTTTIGLDPSAMQDNFYRDSLTYLPMPDSDYAILTTTGNIPAGSRLDTFQIVFFPDKFDLTKNFMLPIAVTTTPSYTISGNFGKMYLHTIGNPIAGVYNQEWIRYNNAAGTGVPAYDEQVGPSVFAPTNGTTINTTSGTGPIYVLTFVDSLGTLTDFAVTFDAASVKAAGITITSGPFIILADPINKKYTFNYTYNNSAGSPRNITDKFY